MLRQFVADLHVHSLLSPCADVEMSPRNIIRQAVLNGIDIVAITDHNASANVRAFQQAAQGTGVTILPAMEVETKEEIHLVTLFEDSGAISAWENMVNQHLPDKKNDDNKFGGQFVVDAEDELVSVEERLLLTSLTLGVEEVVEQVNALGGLCIASHVDRPSYSLISQLGFIPPGIKLTALELSGRMSKEDVLIKFPAFEKWPLILSSDAHSIDRFIQGPKTVFWLEAPTLSEIRSALTEGRTRWRKA